MKWKLPPKIKIYEALGAIGDGRIEMVDGKHAKVFSSSRNKFYSVEYDPEGKAIMANDNGSYWQGYLGYPAIAFLMLIGAIKFDQKYSMALKDIKWKDINTQFKNDFNKTEDHIRGELEKRGIVLSSFNHEVEWIFNQIEKMDLVSLGNKTKPPAGY